MKRIFLLCSIVLGGVILTPCFSFSFSHIPGSSYNCNECHSAHGGPLNPVCTDCHNNSSGGNYSDFNTIEMATHSSVVIGSDKYDPWEQYCSDCHIGHEQNGLTSTEGLADPSYVLVDLVANQAVSNAVDQTTTFTTVEIGNIYDPDWLNPVTWGEKTGPERGLLFLINLGTYSLFEVISATDTTITIRNESTVFTQAPADNPISAQLIYGMHINDVVNGTSVKFSGPKTMANDESGTGLDPTPDGICQVCHTQTTHWRNDGSEANHFSGQNCTMCHPHDQGFKPVTPLLCP